MAALEIRLAPGDAPVDLSVCLLEPRQALAVAPLLPPASSHVSDFLHAWAAGRWRPGPVHSIWLEFDLDREPGEGLPAPVVSARLQGAPERDEIVQSLLPRLHGGPLNGPQGHLFDRAWEAVPDGCRPLYVFSLAARGQRAVRLEIYGEELGALLEWLRRLGRPTADGRSVSAFARAERLHVSCDIGPAGDLPLRAGLEGSFRRLPHREPRWQEMLDELVERSGCDPGKRLALDSWPGQSRTDTGSCARVLSHVKTTTLAADWSLEPKVYLLLEHRPREPAQVVRPHEARFEPRTCE